MGPVLYACISQSFSSSFCHLESEECLFRGAKADYCSSLKESSGQATFLSVECYVVNCCTYLWDSFIQFLLRQHSILNVSQEIWNIRSRYLKEHCLGKWIRICSNSLLSTEDDICETGQSPLDFSGFDIHVTLWLWESTALDSLDIWAGRICTLIFEKSVGMGTGKNNLLWNSWQLWWGCGKVFQNSSIKTSFQASMAGIFAIDYASPMLQLVFTSRCLKFKAQDCVSKLLFLGGKNLFERKFVSQMNF